MLHHASFNARDPQAVASVLAEMLVAPRFVRRRRHFLRAHGLSASATISAR
ncbi:hypothetical protein NKH34_19945 [Mesorhizobium sp. M1148]|uniref:hypothetical protein n=1 Tax=unclassified Mesorhizobium TaxID=325217 RepID=UPI00333C99AA